MTRMTIRSAAMLSLIAEMIWDEALRKQRVELLHQQIDEALMVRDEDAFLQLTNELNELH